MTAAVGMARIVSTGRYLPSRILTNDDLAQLVDTSDQWIRERTGIRERRIAGDDESAAAMGAKAALVALERAGLAPADVDILIVSTATPDRLLPAMACYVQTLIGAENAMAWDLIAACSGFMYAVSMAEGYLAAGRCETVLIVSAEKMSSIVDWTDRSTCVLFGDGAGAVVMQRSEDGAGLLSSHLRSDGSMAELLWRPAGGRLTAEALSAGDHFLSMQGREIFKNAVRCMADAAQKALASAGLTADDVDLMVPHQANIRIIEATAKRSGIPMDRVYVNVDRYGNISSATIPIALDEAQEKGLIGPGSIVLTTTFGAGLTWGAMVIRL